MSRPLGALYVCYLTITDPLVETQVVAYLEGLAQAGHRIHLLTFEPNDVEGAEETAERERELAERGVTWHRARYHKRPSLPATIFDAATGALRARRLMRQHDLDLMHARSHVPAAIAMLARRRFIFDVRGLMAQEYVDAGNWKAGGVPFRLTNAVQRLALRRACGAVVLTDAARELLFGSDPGYPVEVIPCCVDLAGFRSERRPLRRSDPVVAYVGKFGGWYMAHAMAELFARARARWPGSRFLILTQSDAGAIAAALDAAGVPPESYTIGSEPPARVGVRLVEADLGLSLIKPAPSKIASSPTKNAEYLAAGLPLVATAGVAGTDELAMSDPGVVVMLPRFDSVGYDAALEEVEGLLMDPETPERCRAAADGFSLKARGIPAYRRLYERVGAGSG